MIEYFQKNLLKNISMEEYKRLLTCLDGRSKQPRAGEAICNYDQGLNDIGTIGKGITSVACYEFDGTRAILERLGLQDTFDHLLSYEGSGNAGIDMVSNSACDTLFIRYATTSSPRTEARTYHHQLTQNPLDMTPKHTLNLSRRVEILSQRTVCEKLIYYFLQLTAQTKNSSFRLPFTMVGLADYLSTDRSVMTRELKRMREERIIEMDKRNVHLYI